MEKLNLGEVKKTTRVKKGVVQEIRLFTKSQRKLIMDAVENRPDTMTIEDVLNLNEVSPAVYYTWVRNAKEDLKEDTQELPNPLATAGNKQRLFFNENHLMAFYRANSSELDALLQVKYEEWIKTDVYAQIASKITHENIKEVAKAGNITVDELTSFLQRDNNKLSYFSVEAMKSYLGINM